MAPPGSIDVDDEGEQGHYRVFTFTANVSAFTSAGP